MKHLKSINEFAQPDYDTVNQVFDAPQEENITPEEFQSFADKILDKVPTVGFDRATAEMSDLLKKFPWLKTAPEYSDIYQTFLTQWHKFKFGGEFRWNTGGGEPIVH